MQSRCGSCKRDSLRPDRNRRTRKGTEFSKHRDCQGAALRIGSHAFPSGFGKKLLTHSSRGLVPASPTNREIARTIFRYSAASIPSVSLWPNLTERITSEFFAISDGFCSLPVHKGAVSSVRFRVGRRRPRILNRGRLTDQFVFIASQLDIKPPRIFSMTSLGSMMYPRLGGTSDGKRASRKDPNTW